MFSWIRKQKPVAILAAEIRPINITGDTIEAWRQNAQLCESFRAEMETPLMRRFLSILYRQIPSGYPVRGQIVNETMAAIELGRNQGHMGVIDIINLLQQPTAKTQEIEQDYGSRKTADVWSD